LRLNHPAGAIPQPLRHLLQPIQEQRDPSSSKLREVRASLAGLSVGAWLGLLEGSPSAVTMTSVNSIFAIVSVIQASDVIVVARRRAGLTQQELGRRMGVPQATVARWESGFSEPKFRAVQEAVGACGLDLTMGFANADEGSWNSLIFEQLRLAPAERVRQLSNDDFDRVGVLQTIGASGVRTIVVGEVAGALHGWPLPLDPQGELDVLVREEDRKRIEAILAGTPSAKRVRVVTALHGASGYADLARNCVSLDVDGVNVQVAALVDLLRIAHSENGRYSRRFTRAFDETLRLTERPRSPSDNDTRKLTAQQAREKADEWLAPSTARSSH
jgi:transcriptional regulator with XRE-family HTH domain